MAVHLTKRIIRLLVLSLSLIILIGLTSSHSNVNDYLSDYMIKFHEFVTIKAPSIISYNILKGKFEESYEVLKTDNDVEELYGINKGVNISFIPSHNSTNMKMKACLLSLVRNSDMWSIVESIRHVEDRFNKNYKYTWVFLNDELFSDKFKNTISNVVSGEVKFGLIPQDHWSYPNWIDQKKAAETRKSMAQDVIYGGSESYRHMCRYESGFFWRHPLLDEFDWYWRVEPDIKLYCDIEYDVFKWMNDNNKVYGFTISIREYESTIPTLWQTTKKFIAAHPGYINQNNMLNFISDDGGETYNLCHFWSNFEIANLNFWRSKLYSDYFQYLDHAGGFFYERWGDAPIHSIAVSLFLPKNQIHFFNDIGYYHPPYTNCPSDNNIWTKNKCSCDQDQDFTFQDYSCGKKFFEVNNNL